MPVYSGSPSGVWRFGVTVAAISSRLYLCLAHDEVLLYLLVIALALQLQTILGEQLASDDQAADVVDIGTVISLGDGIARVYGWCGRSMDPQVWRYGRDSHFRVTHHAWLISWRVRTVAGVFGGSLVSAQLELKRSIMQAACRNGSGRCGPTVGSLPGCTTPYLADRSPCSSASRAYPGHCNAGWRSRAVHRRSYDQWIFIVGHRRRRSYLSWRLSATGLRGTR